MRGGRSRSGGGVALELGGVDGELVHGEHDAQGLDEAVDDDHNEDGDDEEEDEDEDDGSVPLSHALAQLVLGKVDGREDAEDGEVEVGGAHRVGDRVAVSVADAGAEASS